MQKHPNAIVSFYGVLYSGCFYVPIDDAQPQGRISIVDE